jgi:PhnB protein
MSVKPIPEGQSTVSPYLIVAGAAELIDFMKHTFGAQEVLRMARPDGAVGHAEVRIGDSNLMVAEASPPQVEVMTAMIHVYVDDADAVYKRALAAGATSMREPADQFYGDRTGGVKDAFGNQWWMATRKEDLSPEELQKRAAAAMQQQG